jgi:spore maturation protein SpmA
MNIIFLTMVMIAFIVAAIKEIFYSPGTMSALSTQTLASANQSVQLALGLVGAMALFLGLMNVAEKGGLLKVLARLMRPGLVRLFPSVPPNHPAMGAMILNLSANALGLGNAATPFGIDAMRRLEELNPHPGTATDAQVLLCAINTASLQLLPATVVALRAAAGARDPGDVIGPTLLATGCAATTAVLAAKLLARLAPAGPRRPAPPPGAKIGSMENEP